MKRRYWAFHQVFAISQSTCSLFSFLSSFAIKSAGCFTLIVCNAVGWSAVCDVEFLIIHPSFSESGEKIVNSIFLFKSEF